MWRKKCDLLITFFHELPGNMCHLKYPLNGAGCFCRGCLTGWTGSPATWLPGWWPRWPPGYQGGDQGRRTAAQGGHVTHGERGVLYPGRLDHHLFVLHHHQPWPSPCHSWWTRQWRVLVLTTWHSIETWVRRSESHHIAWRYHMWGLDNYWGKKQIAKVLVLGGTFGRSGPPCFVRPCTLWVRRPFLWLTQTVLLLILYNKQQILDIRDIPTIGRIIPIL